MFVSKIMIFVLKYVRMAPNGLVLRLKEAIGGGDELACTFELLRHAFESLSERYGNTQAAW